MTEPTTPGHEPVTPAINGRFETTDGIDWYRIDGVDLLEPFLINVVTSDDQWIYVSSSGALTAGRQTANRALFPYETDDRLHRMGQRTGPLTLIEVSGRDEVWQPFSTTTPIGVVDRSVAKTILGNQLRFEEHHPELGLTFSYTWAGAGRFGLSRRCSLRLDDDRSPVEITVLDGLLDVLPAGVELATQRTSSTLVDAYRRSELDQDTNLAVFSLEALISDHADPAEALSATVIWSRGLNQPTIALSERQIRGVRSGRRLEPEHHVTGRKGAFLQSTSVRLEPGRPLEWVTVADVEQDHVDVVGLQKALRRSSDLAGEVAVAVADGAAELQALVAEADGLQETADRAVTAHHLANTLFNCMRGGVPLDGHRVSVDEIQRFVTERNKPAGQRFEAAAAGLDATVEIDTLRQSMVDDADLIRLVNEYLPLTFSRRHGDPSRPWNTFHIPPRTPDRPPPPGYEGNWRDIFQNWEALVHSFPDYIESVVSKFLSASTVDGHNPYRVTDRGIDWEVPEPGGWGNFGYWGDHQIVYLHRLLLAAERFHPGKLSAMLERQQYSYSEVPYRLRPYQQITEDPKDTLIFDSTLDREIDRRVEILGADGRLVQRRRSSDDAAVHHASLAEKLMVPALAKLSNLVAGAGIWLNTQRPEWNDANNALVGNGVSTVTLFHLRDYLALVDEIMADGAEAVPIATSVLHWMAGLESAFTRQHPKIPLGAEGDGDRRRLLDQIGLVFEAYRADAYRHGPGEAVAVDPADLRRFIVNAMPHLDHAADSAWRPDGLVHTYWLLQLSPGHAGISPLYEMLEGQVAALGSVDLDPDRAMGLIDTLAGSELYRPDQRSYVLYPNHPPARFIDKNRIPEDLADSTALALAADRGIVRRDDNGALRFAPDLQSARHLQTALDQLRLDEADGPMTEDVQDTIMAAYEAVFDHHSFTGRSRTMYRYEGLGSIYWHMVSKLLFAIQEQVVVAVDAGRPATTIADLAEGYHRVRSGLGWTKSAAEQGSFPTDPHSHTPAGAGAQQPGMTGQVKEGVLIRLGELGVEVRAGIVRFRPLLLDRSEFLTEQRRWAPLGPDTMLSAGSLGFTFCAVPIVYRLGDRDPSVTVRWADGRETVQEGIALDRTTSRALLGRTGRIQRIDVGVSEATLQIVQQR